MLHYGDEALKRHAQERREYEKKYPNESWKTNLTPEEIEGFEMESKFFEGLTPLERIEKLREFRKIEKLLEANKKVTESQKIYQSPTTIKIPKKIDKIKYQLTDKEDNYGQKYILVTSEELPGFMLEAKNDEDVIVKIRAYLPIYLKQLTISNFNKKQGLR